MNDVLAERIRRKLDVMPDEQAYQVLDYIEFLESKYAQRAAGAPAFQKVADNATAQLYKSGAITPIYTKWFLTAIPPKYVNLNVPVSTPLKNEFANPTNSGDPAVYK